MAENLAYLMTVNPSSEGSLSEPASYVYGYEGTNVGEAKAFSNYHTYGVLYNWSAALIVCPIGWHLPSSEEWISLMDYLINNRFGFNRSGNDIAKSFAAKSGWGTSSIPGTIGDDQSSNNRSGFTALPGGIRYYTGGFFNLTAAAYFWSSRAPSEYFAPHLNIYDNVDTVFLVDTYRSFGFSVRCISDEQP